MTLTLVQAEAIVERIARAALYRQNLAFCPECESINLTTVEDKNMIVLSLSTDLSPQGREASKKLLKEILMELLKRFNDVHIKKDKALWCFEITVA